MKETLKRSELTAIIADLDDNDDVEVNVFDQSQSKIIVKNVIVDAAGGIDIEVFLNDKACNINPDVYTTALRILEEDAGISESDLRVAAGHADPVSFLTTFRKRT